MKSSFEIGEILFTICAGTYEEAEEAFTWLYHNSWEEIWGVLNARATLCGLSIEDKKSVVIHAFQEFWKKARNGNIKDTDKDPRALLHSIAFNRAIDLIRRNTSKKRHLPKEEWDGYVKEVIRESSFAVQWRSLERKALADDLIEDFRTWMMEQDGVRRRTAFAMAEFFPDIANPKEIHEMLIDSVDPPPTYESVKKARQDVLNKFRASIDQKYRR
ncbi:MAG: hypothetical protein CMO55_21975 [Verrucomicrobiales bacterium]|nr:hypothetical protein [Verrucomicrobiales bacterium]